MISVHLPSSKGLIQTNASTVQELIEGIKGAHPDVYQKLMTSNGVLRRTAGIFVNDERAELNDAILPDAKVTIVLAISGG
jgi:molybdopterin converting factor small subunit